MSLQQGRCYKGMTNQLYLHYITISNTGSKNQFVFALDECIMLYTLNIRYSNVNAPIVTYSQIHCISKDTELFIVTGDYNAKVVTHWMDASGAIGKSGVDELNSSGESLIQFANANSLVLTNTCFKRVNANRLWTWDSPDGSIHNTIDRNFPASGIQVSPTHECIQELT